MADDQNISIGIVSLNDGAQCTLTPSDEFLSGFRIRFEVKIVWVQRFVIVVYVDVDCFELVQLAPYWAVLRLPIPCLTKAFA